MQKHVSPPTPEPRPAPALPPHDHGWNPGSSPTSLLHLVIPWPPPTCTVGKSPRGAGGNEPSFPRCEELSAGWWPPWRRLVWPSYLPFLSQLVWYITVFVVPIIFSYIASLASYERLMLFLFSIMVFFGSCHFFFSSSFFFSSFSFICFVSYFF
jgi:hypothetical protein